MWKRWLNQLSGSLFRAFREGGIIIGKGFGVRSAIPNNTVSSSDQSRRRVEWRNGDGRLGSAWPCPQASRARHGEPAADQWFAHPPCRDRSPRRDHAGAGAVGHPDPAAYSFPWLLIGLQAQQFPRCPKNLRIQIDFSFSRTPASTARRWISLAATGPWRRRHAGARPRPYGGAAGFGNPARCSGRCQVPQRCPWGHRLVLGRDRAHPNRGRRLHSR
jgi:hypothetical protein